MPHNKENKGSKQKNFINENSIFTLIILIFIINKVNNKEPVFGELSNDEYIVTMGNNPAFPLENNEDLDIKNERLILDLENQKDLFDMVKVLKPHMSSKNRLFINNLEKWLLLLRDLNQLTTSLYTKSNIEKDPENEEPKSLIKFLYDIKPFIHTDYQNHIEEFIQGINSILDIQNNIFSLQYALNQSRNSNDDITKVNTIINALNPFMGENQKKNLAKFKQLSSIIEMINLSEDIVSTEHPSKNQANSKTAQGEENQSDILEILDIFDKPSDDINHGENHSFHDMQMALDEPIVDVKQSEDPLGKKEEFISEQSLEAIDQYESIQENNTGEA